MLWRQVSQQEAASQAVAQRRRRDAVGAAVAACRAQGIAPPWITWCLSPFLQCHHTDMAGCPGRGTWMPLSWLTLQHCWMGGNCPAHCWLSEIGNFSFSFHEKHHEQRDIGKNIWPPQKENFKTQTRKFPGSSKGNQRNCTHMNDSCLFLILITPCNMGAHNNTHMVWPSTPWIPASLSLDFTDHVSTALGCLASREQRGA